jgi:hypothetical protein
LSFCRLLFRTATGRENACLCRRLQSLFASVAKFGLRNDRLTRSSFTSWLWSEPRMMQSSFSADVRTWLWLLLPFFLLVVSDHPAGPEADLQTAAAESSRAVEPRISVCEHFCVNDAQQDLIACRLNSGIRCPVKTASRRSDVLRCLPVS